MNKQELLNKGYREYPSPALDVFYNREICQHAGKCVRGNHQVFNLDQRPWIQAGKGEMHEIENIIDSCPSGALKYIEVE